MTSELITPDELAALGDTVRILDVRWRLDKPDGHPDYLAGHIPGAVYVDLNTELAGHGEPDEGRHPLPAIGDLQAAARRWGITDGDTVVVYDDLNGMSAARAWWLLRYAGVQDVRLLDGALSGWVRAGFALESGEVSVSAGSVSLSYGHLRVLTIDEAGDLPSTGTLLDARAGERFRGEIEPVDPKAGHIPGAVSAPTSENVDAEGRFLSPEALRERFGSLGVESSVGVYCGSGVTAAHEALALTLAGFEPALFPGSWSAWSNSPGGEVATGT